MKAQLAAITLRDLDEMRREELIENLMQFASFFARPLNRTAVSALPTPQLRAIAGKTRRKFQALGY